MRRLAIVLILMCAGAGAGQALAAPSTQPAGQLGLTVGPDGALLRLGKPYRAIGINYFDAFYRHLKDPKNTTFDAGFAVLEKHRIPFVRMMGCGFWPVDQKLYTENREEFFKRFDAVIRSAEKHHIGVIPSLFWNTATFPDLVGEPVSAWGDPASKTRRYMRQYVKDVVLRYRSSPAIWGWEFGNEYNLGANLPNASEHRPPVWPTLGTAASRTEKDEWTYEQIRSAFAEFAAEVRKYDPARIISTGDSLPRTAAWHNWKEKSWSADTAEQFAQMLELNNPDPVAVISGHAYEGEAQRIRDAMAVATRLKKPLFIGEFGAQGPRDKAEKPFKELLAAIEESKVPLACLWVFDLAQQTDSFSVTAENERAWQLQAITEANARLHAR